jgi:DNA-binding MarR family transcriptional regulator
MVGKRIYLGFALLLIILFSSRIGEFMSQWTFLTNHTLVLSFLARHPLITANEISSKIGVTERAVRKIIADFDKEGYIVKGKEGRRVRYKINSRMSLRHKTQRDKVIGDLLKVVG